jgi:hypothetical protein
MMSQYLDLLNLSIEQIDYAAIFMPYDPAWMNRFTQGYINTLPSDGAMIIQGKFDPESKYGELKSGKWKESKYVNKKVLWWSTGENFLRNPAGQECLARLGDDKLLVSGSEDLIKGVLDVAGHKSAGLESMGVFNDIYHDFFENDHTMASVFVKASEKLRENIRRNAGDAGSALVSTAMQYIENVHEAALSVSMGAEYYSLDGYLGMDSGNNAMIIAAALQVGGGLAGMLADNNPHRKILESLTVTRSERNLRLHSRMSKRQLRELMSSGSR